MEQFKDTDLRVRVLLSTYNALLGKIHPDIRLITIDWGMEHYNILAYFDRAVTAEDFELLRNITDEVAADIPQFIKFNEYAEFASVPIKDLRPLTKTIYVRYGEFDI